MSPERTSARQKRMQSRKLREGLPVKRDPFESETTMLQQQIGNRSVQRLLATSEGHRQPMISLNTRLKVSSDSIFRQPTKPTLIDLPSRDRIDDAYGAGSLDQTQWTNSINAAKQALASGDTPKAKRIYLALYADVAKLAQASEVVGSSESIHEATFDSGNVNNAKPGLNFLWVDYSDFRANGKTAYVSDEGEFGKNFRLPGGVLPPVGIVLIRSVFDQGKEKALMALRHEMVHAEILDTGEVALSDPKAKSGYVAHSKANTELLAYLEGFMTIFHLGNPADNSPAIVELLGALDGSNTYGWAGADPLVRSEALGRIQEYYCHALGPRPRHRNFFDAWVNGQLSKARSDVLLAPSPATKAEIERGMRQPTKEETLGEKVRETKAVDFYESLQNVIARNCRGLTSHMKL